MDEFYTPAIEFAIWKQELEAEAYQNYLLDTYDPYADFDDDFTSDDDYEEYEYQDENYENEEFIDSYAESSLFGWD
jgi:hypothetical protein